MHVLAFTKKNVEMFLACIYDKNVEMNDCFIILVPQKMGHEKTLNLG